ncbi:MAG: 50S ribosomal protein L20, partial [Candidatus Neomarinimicrobiota bacterium]
MSRAVSSVPRHRRHRKIIKRAKGYYGARSRNYRTAMDALTKALSYAYRDRRQRKRQFRRLWITRINAAARQHNMSYSPFMHALREKNLQLDRKSLADMAVRDP